MRAVADTSVIVAAILDGGERRDACVAALRTASAAAAGHAWFETISVLTRLPADSRLTVGDAHRALAASVDGARYLSGAEQRGFQKWLPGSSVSGGAVYDALVGWVAKSAGLPLLTRDLRALPTYRSLGVEVLLVDPSLA